MSTRDRLLSAATELIDVGGPDAVTLRAVAAAVGVSHNAPYKHFADKEALLAVVAAEELSRLTTQLSASGVSSNDPWLCLRRLARTYVDWALAHPRRFRLVFGVWSRHDDALDQAAGRAREAVSQAVSAAVASGAGAVMHPERLSGLLMACANGAVELSLTGHLSPDGKGAAGPDGLVEDLLDLLENRR